MRSVADGLDIEASAKRYLGVEHAAAARGAHRRVVERLRALARRNSDARWRLIGLVISAPATTKPSIDDWAAENGLDGWSHSELLEMYEEAFPADRREQRAQRLRRRQRDAIQSLQDLAAEQPQPTDLVAGWFDEATSERLKRSGILMLQDLRHRVDQGGRWWLGLPAIGRTKAANLASYLDTLLPPPQPVIRLGHAALRNAIVAASSQRQRGSEAIEPPALPASTLPQSNRAAPRPGGLSAQTDAQAIESWIAARAGSDATVKSYRREAERLVLWASVERRKPISSMNVDDCLAYMAFLEHLPEHWKAKGNAARLSPGWAPFSRQLSVASRRHAIVVVSSLFEWLAAAGYLVGNPWRLVNRRTGDDAAQDLLATRAFTPEAWQSFQAFVQAQPPSPATHRIRFLLDFLEATGLRAAEVLSCKLGDFKRLRGRWFLQVHGKGSRNRVVVMPRQAERAIGAYLEARGLLELGVTGPEAPLVASLRDPMEPVGYRSLYDSLKSWIRLAIAASDLPAAERREAERGSLHWLRHTCGTRAVERGTPLSVVQSQFGHADPRTTARYSRAQLEHAMEAMDKAFS